MSGHKICYPAISCNKKHLLNTANSSCEELSRRRERPGGHFRKSCRKKDTNQQQSTRRDLILKWYQDVGTEAPIKSKTPESAEQKDKLVWNWAFPN